MTANRNLVRFAHSQFPEIAINLTSFRINASVYCWPVIGKWVCQVVIGGHLYNDTFTMIKRTFIPSWRHNPCRHPETHGTSLQHSNNRFDTRQLQFDEIFSQSKTWWMKDQVKLMNFFYFEVCQVSQGEQRASTGLQKGADVNFLHSTNRHTQKCFFGILLIQTEIRLYLPSSDWFGSKRTSVWIQINRKMVNTIWFQFESKRFQKVFSASSLW